MATEYWTKDARALRRRDVTVLVVGSFVVAALGLAVFSTPVLVLWLLGLL